VDGIAAAPPDRPTVLILDAGLAAASADPAADLAALPSAIVVVADDEALAASLGGAGDRLLTLDRGGNGASLRSLRFAFTLAAARLAAERTEHELARTRSEVRDLNRIGMALMTERDPDRLLVMILEQAQRMTQSDAGSIYLVEKGPDGDRHLRFKLAQTHSLPDLPFVSSTLPLDRTSLAGYAAVTGEALILDDAYEIPAKAPYSLNRSFDERFGYRTKSMLVVPMKDHRDEVVGVLQLINRKRDPAATITSEAAATEHVLPYEEHEVELVHSLAGQAAVSIENSHLYLEIQNIFEAFVKAAVTAIDQRDPTTAGHSVRVAALTCDLAEALSGHGRGLYAGLRFTREQMRELRYAALLHDFGKVGVREEVLVKAKKLPPYLLERIEGRFELIRRTAEADHYRRATELLRDRGGDAHPLLEEAAAEFRRRLEEIDASHAAVRSANEPSVLHQEAAAVLDEIAERTFRGPADAAMPFLTTEELQFLRIPRGTLDERERLEIESHVEQTFRFLTQIPWTDDLRNVAHIAHGHHEKLDGRGYPRRVTADEIPVQTRLMTIADIFDALTASDRPYKRALPVAKAIDILKSEARDGMLDSDLVELLVETEAYRSILDRDWREL
jgi:HD-GYP domain-containing protein (c-di-GMP phosphodiesterase class II)